MLFQDQQQPNASVPPVTESKIIGKSTPRVDGPRKTTGTAKYASDFHFPNLVFAWPATATIASGTIAAIDTTEAEKMPGVLAVYTHRNMPALYRTPPAQGFSMMQDERRPPLEDNVVRYWGQYVAVAVAQTVEQARAAAEAVKVTYSKAPHDTRVKLLGTPLSTPEMNQGSKRGDAAAAFQSAPVKHDAVYCTPPETHNPIELHASVATYDNGSFTLYETSQAIFNHRDVMSAVLGVSADRVEIVTEFLGSGFGGKLWPWPHSLLAAACARSLNRPVKLVVSRSMMFQSVGHRPATAQQVRLAAGRDGKLLAIAHNYVNHTAILDDFDEGCGEATALLYACPNVSVTSGLVRRNVGSATAMRGPGAVPGLYATESAMDELAIKLKMDPVQFRIVNDTLIDESNNLPFSSRHLKECLTTGAERFGWAKRNPAIGSMRNDEGMTLGWGVAACSWGAMRIPAEATVELVQDGTARVICGTQDVGTGTYTVLAQLAAHETGLPVTKVSVSLGRTTMPEGPISGGSFATASVTPAVLEASRNAVQKVLAMAGAKGAPFSGKKPEELAYADGMVRLKDGAGNPVSFAEVLKANRVSAATGTAKSSVSATEKYSSHSFGAHFVEVTWQPEIARLRASRVVTVIDAGRMINPRPARNQIEGAVVMGLGMAMFEHTEYDKRTGGTINSNLADYVMAVNADCPEIDVTFVDYPDYNLNPLGARGVGEIGMAGLAAAVTNATYHATGIRVRDLPIRVEDLLTAPMSLV
jgi:xanthine dehydrogenase YagR molybdenum-binding subunit